MPGYPFLAKTELNYHDIAERLKTLRDVGVPYTDEMIENAKADLERQLDPAAEGVKEFLDTLSEGAGAAIRRQSELCVGARCRDCLSADARHSCRLRQIRRRRAQSAVTRHDL